MIVASDHVGFIRGIHNTDVVSDGFLDLGLRPQEGSFGVLV